MATRGRHARDDGPGKELVGRVRRWTQAWVASKEPKTKELKFRRWRQTDERPPELAGPRHAYIVPWKDPEAQPYPQLAPRPNAVTAGGPLPSAAAMGAGPMKRGKLQGSIAANGVAPAGAQQPGQQAAPASKFKLKFTLSQRLDAATGATEPAYAAPGAAAVGAAAAAAPGAAAAAPGAAAAPLGSAAPQSVVAPAPAMQQAAPYAASPAGQPQGAWAGQQQQQQPGGRAPQAPPAPGAAGMQIDPPAPS